MELNNIFPELNDEHNFIFIDKFDKHKYYKGVNLFTILPTETESGVDFLTAVAI